MIYLPVYLPGKIGLNAAFVCRAFVPQRKESFSDWIFGCSALFVSKQQNNHPKAKLFHNMPKSQDLTDEFKDLQVPFS